MPDLRLQVVNRLHRMNSTHATQAWERRRRDPISPHAIAFFYTEPPLGNPPHGALRTAGRLFLGADEPCLARLLYELVEVFGAGLEHGADPRTDLANWTEPMSSRAGYLGLGISSLDTPDATWSAALGTAHIDMDLPGRGYAWLIDGTVLIMDRRARGDFGRVQVTASDWLTDSSGQIARPWTYDRGLADIGRQRVADPDVLTWLHELHTTVALRGRRVR